MMRLLFFVLIFLSFNIHASNPCDIVIKYRVEDSENNKPNGKIFITIESGDSPFVLNLFDENHPEKGFIKSANFSNYRLGEEILVFQDLKPSSYIVRIDNDKCKTSISGLDGITIN